MSLTIDEKALVEEKAKLLRKDVLRMVASAESGHPGGSLSCADIMAVLYFREMRIDPENPKDPDRDRFVMSKGHASPVLYAALAERGFFPVEELMSFRKIDSRLQGHPSMKALPFVEISTGSLGQGISAANGMAIAAKMDERPVRVYVMIGDGEMQEGELWEAAMTAVHRKLDNLVAILDYNGLQIDGSIEEVKSLTGIPGRFRAFGWHVIEIDGHDPYAIAGAFDEARTVKGRPSMVIARTVKGKGVSFMEGEAGWHGKAPKPEQLEQALRELDGGGA
ncbi:MAG TPA: transketolase [Bacillota bacterium]|nr:MAG: Transketolase 2 [Firmicutes bacterium ADurb.Bin153]HNV34795.1 transketolase [Bacillota bacterium]HPU95305.1 transketolase [Bacillota bacterium]